MATVTLPHPIARLTAAERRRRLAEAERAELRARHDLARNIMDDGLMADWSDALHALLQARGQVYSGRIWTHDGRSAQLHVRCRCVEPGLAIAYERFTDRGSLQSRGIVCEGCRGVQGVIAPAAGIGASS